MVGPLRAGEFDHRLNSPALNNRTVRLFFRINSVKDYVIYKAHIPIRDVFLQQQLNYLEYLPFSPICMRLWVYGSK